MLPAIISAARAFLERRRAAEPKPEPLPE
jgi:hypothetical protein